MKQILLLMLIMLSARFVSLGQDTTVSVGKNVSGMSKINEFNSNETYVQPYFGVGDDEAGYSLLYPSANRARKDRKVPWFVERFKISGGFFESINNTDIKVSNTSGSIGTNINFEHDLGFKKDAGTVLGDIQWRATSRSRFDLSYVNITRNSNYSLQQDIVFGDNDYPINTQINAFFNTRIYRFSYGYAILSKPTYEAGLLIGAHIVDVGVGLSAIGNSAHLDLNNDFGFTAPLPDFGVWGGVTLSSRLALTGEFDYLSLTISSINGQIIGFNGLLTYKIVKGLNVSAGYTGFNFEVGVTKPKWYGQFNWGYNGPTVAVSFAFGRRPWVHKD
ncbi:hypothetical protein HDF24_15885 [Mucilaginibacter sp. X4EP1]|uniref:hypothetical protein n=1 Tax=Mucilaginibacter sp. X4EP1 TaxID=2723092 RepID=UPI0021680A62|nr:hypothetical protein [Mucilaginibacter sp. X4EP1]MCS3814840.1 hypothetical protein [Mucilaginibacter sp. X4EP1]